MTAPFALEGFEFAGGGLFDAVNFLLIVSAPEIRFALQFLVIDPFLALVHNEILPQGAGVRAQAQRLELIDDGVANSGIHEIVFRGAGHFLTEVAGESLDTVKDKCFFEKIEIPLDRGFIKLELGTDLREGDFIAHLPCDQGNQFAQLAGIAQLFKGKNILKEV